MTNKNYIFKSDLVLLIQKQTGLNQRQALHEANRIILKEESLADKIYNFAGSSIYSGLVQNFTEQILEYLGIERNTLLGKAIANFIENLRYEQIKNALNSWDEGGCEAWMKSLVDTVSETLVEYIGAKVLTSLKDKGIISREKIGIPDSGPVKELLGDLDINSLIPAITSIEREKLFDVIFPAETREETVAFLCDKLSELEFNFSLEGLTDTLTGMSPFGNEEEE